MKKLAGFQSQLFLIAGAALVLCALLYAHQSAFYAVFSMYADNSDTIGIFRGYRMAQETGLSQWWYGPWINQQVAYFRPITSYIHFFQCWLIDRDMFWLVTCLSMWIYWGICCAVAVLCYLVAGNRWLAVAGGVGLALWHPDYELAFFILADNWACVFFGLVSICSVLATRKHEAKFFPSLAVVSGVASALCKEQGYAWALCALVLTFGLSDNEGRGQSIRTALYLLLVLGSIFLYSGFVVPRPRVGLPTRNYWVSAAETGQWWLVLLLALLVVAGIATYKTRRAYWVLLPPLALLTAPEGPVFALVYIVDTLPVMASALGWLLFYWVVARLYFIRRHSAIPACVALAIATWPTIMVGTDMWHWRAIFWVIFVPPVIAAFCVNSLNLWAQLVSHLRIKRKTPGTISLPAQSYLQ